MAVDASIPLSINPSATAGPDLGKMLTLADMAQDIQGKRVALQRQNSLAQLMSNPNSFAADGSFTPQAIQSAMAIDPGTGMKIKDQNLEQKVAAAKLKAQENDAAAAVFDFKTKAYGIAYDTYQEAKKANRSEDDARAAAQAAKNDAIKNSGGLLSDDDIKQGLAAPFDPATARIFAMANNVYATRQKDTASENRQERELSEREKHDRAIESQSAATLAATLKEGGGASFTPKMGEMMAALAEKGVSLPTGFRSKEQQAALYSGILARNPDKTPDQIADMIKKGEIEFGAQKKETTTAAGIAGKVQVFANELDENIPLVRKAAAAVPRGEWTDLNKLVQMGDNKISDPKLKTLKGYITSTLNAYDALAARGGTDVDKRAENRRLLLSSDGPEAFDAQLKVFENEANVAKKAAYEATKSPELPGVKEKESPTQSNFVINKVYVDGKGNRAKWDGSKFVEVN